MSRRSRSTPSFSLFAFQDIITAVTGISLLITMILALALIRSKRVQAEVPSDRKELDTIRLEIEQLEDEIARNDEKLAQQTKSIAYRPTTPAELDVAIKAGEITNASLRSQQALLKQELTDLKTQGADDIRAQIVEAEADLSTKRKQNQQSEQALQEEVNGLKQKIADWRTGTRFFFNPPKGFSKQPTIIEVSDGKVRVGSAVDTSRGRTYSVQKFLDSLSKYDKSREYFVLFVHPRGIDEHDRIASRLSARGFDYGVDLLGSRQFILGGDR